MATATSFEDLVEMLRRKGAQISSAVSVTSADPVSDTKDVRGLVASRRIKPGEMLFSVPYECALCVPRGRYRGILRDSAALASRLAGVGIPPQDAALSVVLAVERAKGAGSPWWQYLSFLGEPGQTFPCFFSHDDLDELQSPPLAGALERRRNAIRAAAATCDLGELELLQAYQLVASRRFQDRRGRFLFPVVDLMNHDREPSCDFDFRRAGLRVKALRAIEEGEPLTLRYGTLPTDLLLLEMGFVLPENEHDRLLVRPCDLRRSLEAAADPGTSESFRRWRSEEFCRMLPDTEDEDLLLLECVPGRGIFWEELALDLCELALATSHDDADRDPRRRQTRRFCDMVAGVTRGLFGTSLDEDAAALNEETLSENRRLALEFRIEQKEVLELALEILSEESLSEEQPLPAPLR